MQLEHLLWTKSNSPIFRPIPTNNRELAESLIIMRDRMASAGKTAAYEMYAKDLKTRIHVYPFKTMAEPDGSGVSNDVCFESLRRTTLGTFSNLPPCIWSGCARDVAQGLCPQYGGRKSACCLTHFRLAVKEGFIHPGLIRPGTTLVPGSGTFKRTSDLTPPSNVKRHMGKDGTVTTSVPAPAMCADSELSNFESILHLADKSRLPAKWMKAAKESNATASFLSVFDGAEPDLNRAGLAFVLSGLPPVDIKSTAPLDL